MTMGSYLHVNSSLLGTERIQFYLQMLQSSSPSYPIMGSLDLARAYLATFTDEDRNELVKAISEFKVQLSRISEIEVLEPPKGVLVDPLKVSIKSRRGLSGYELQALLEEVGIYTELADPQNVLFVLPLLKKEHSYPFLKTVDKIEAAIKGEGREACIFHKESMERILNDYITRIIILTNEAEQYEASSI